MQLNELQVLYRKGAAAEIAAKTRVNELEQEIDYLIDENDAFQQRAERQLKVIVKLRAQLDEMVSYITTTQEFYAFIISRTWTANATDRDMVMAFLAALPALR